MEHGCLRRIFDIHINISLFYSFYFLVSPLLLCLFSDMLSNPSFFLPPIKLTSIYRTIFSLVSIPILAHVYYFYCFLNFFIVNHLPTLPTPVLPYFLCFSSFSVTPNFSFLNNFPLFPFLLLLLWPHTTFLPVSAASFPCCFCAWYLVLCVLSEWSVGCPWAGPCTSSSARRTETTHQYQALKLPGEVLKAVLLRCALHAGFFSRLYR